MFKFIKKIWNNIIYKDVITTFNDQHIIEYINQRLLEEMEITFSDISKILREKYIKNKEQLLERKNIIKFRKIALEETSMEKISSMVISSIAIAVPIITATFSILSNINEFELLFTLAEILFILYMGLSICLIGLLVNHVLKSKLRTKEIAYCAFVLDMLEKIEQERT